MPLYRDGKITLTKNSRSVTGHGTKFGTETMPGDVLILSEGEWVSHCYEIHSIESDTKLTIDVESRDDVSEAEYVILRSVSTATNLYLMRKIDEFLKDRQVSLVEFREWMLGKPDGGPEGDGRYPLTDRYGVTTLVYSPEAMTIRHAQGIEDLEDVLGALQDFSQAAQDAETAAIMASGSASDAASSAQSAASSESAAQLSKEAAESSALDAASSAQSAASSESAAQLSKEAAESSALDAASSAQSAAGSAQDASFSATQGEYFKNLAQDWAEKLDGPVEGEGRSAKYWAYAAEALAEGGVVSLEGKGGHLTLEDINLDKVDNTSDADKPISTATQAALDKKADKTELFSGSYDDLKDKPTLFTGSYDDLTNKPNLFSGSYDDLTNKPNLFSGSYDDLSDKPTIPSASEVAKGVTAYGWGDHSQESYVKEAPKDGKEYVRKDGAWEIAQGFGGDYEDLINKPSIPSFEDVSKGVTAYEWGDHRQEGYAKTKEDVGLGQVDNTKDSEKPVSQPVQAALDLKEDKSNLKEGAYKDVVDNVGDTTSGKLTVTGAFGLGGTDLTTINYVDENNLPRGFYYTGTETTHIKPTGIAPNLFIGGVAGAVGGGVFIARDGSIYGLGRSSGNWQQLLKTLNRNDLVESLGTSSDKALTQKFITEILDTKADKEDVEAHLKKDSNLSDLTDYQEALANLNLNNVDNVPDLYKPISILQEERFTAIEEQLYKKEYTNEITTIFQGVVGGGLWDSNLLPPGLADSLPNLLGKASLDFIFDEPIPVIKNLGRSVIHFSESNYSGVSAQPIIPASDDFNWILSLRVAPVVRQVIYFQTFGVADGSFQVIANAEMEGGTIRTANGKLLVFVRGNTVENLEVDIPHDEPFTLTISRQNGKLKVLINRVEKAITDIDVDIYQTTKGSLGGLPGSPSKGLYIGRMAFIPKTLTQEEYTILEEWTHEGFENHLLRNHLKELPTITTDTYISLLVEGNPLEWIEDRNILYQSEVHKAIVPASCTKVITCLAAFEILQNDLGLNVERYVKDQEITVLSGETTPRSGGYLEEGDTIKIYDLLTLMMVRSDNESASVVARYFGDLLKQHKNLTGNSGVEVFVEYMNQIMATIGKGTSHFTNPHGLHDPNQTSTVYDLAVASLKAMQYKVFRDLWSIDQTTVEILRGGNTVDVTVGTTNFMMGNPDVIGGKTGTIVGLTNNLIILTEEQRNNNQILTVVAGSDSSNNRYRDARNLISTGAYNYKFPQRYPIKL